MKTITSCQITYDHEHELTPCNERYVKYDDLILILAETRAKLGAEHIGMRLFETYVIMKLDE